MLNYTNPFWPQSKGLEASCVEELYFVIVVCWQWSIGHGRAGSSCGRDLIFKAHATFFTVSINKNHDILAPPRPAIRPYHMS